MDGGVLVTPKEVGHIYSLCKRRGGDSESSFQAKGGGEDHMTPVTLDFEGQGEGDCALDGMQTDPQVKKKQSRLNKGKEIASEMKEPSSLDSTKSTKKLSPLSVTLAEYIKQAEMKEKKWAKRAKQLKDIAYGVDF